jgi:hypothetical protein
MRSRFLPAYCSGILVAASYATLAQEGEHGSPEQAAGRVEMFHTTSCLHQSPQQGEGLLWFTADSISADSGIGPRRWTWPSAATEPTDSESVAGS